MKNTSLVLPLAGASDPDTGDGGYSAVLTTPQANISATSPAGGIVTVTNATTGAFDFDPPPGATGNVTFTYTVCDTGNPASVACSAATTVTVNVGGTVIWFVQPGAAGTNDGRLSNPFTSLASVPPVDSSG